MGVRVEAIARTRAAASVRSARVSFKRGDGLDTSVRRAFVSARTRLGTASAISVAPRPLPRETWAMRSTSRRDFLTSAAAAGSFLLACGDDAGTGGGGQGAGGGDPCGAPDPFVGGELRAVLGFVDDGDTPLGVPFDVGWDGRLYTDLSTLRPDTLVTSNEM